jgi:hypothetical protein
MPIRIEESWIKFCKYPCIPSIRLGIDSNCYHSEELESFWKHFITEGRKKTDSPEGYHLMKKRVFVTGIGLISPVGITIDDYWQSLIAGKSGVEYIKKFFKKDILNKIAAEIKKF